MATVEIDDANSAVVYSKPASGHHWTTQGSGTSFNNTLALTRTRNAWAELTFEGSQVTVFGLVSEAGNVDAVSSYSIDGGRPVEVTMPRTTTVLSRVVFFRSGTLQNGNHTIRVTNLVEGDFLWLDSFAITPNPTPTIISQSASVIVTDPPTYAYTPTGEFTTVKSSFIESVVVQSATTRTLFAMQYETVTTVVLRPTPVMTETTDTDPTPSVQASLNAQFQTGSKADVPVGALVGGIIGGLFVLVFSVFVFLWWRRGRRQSTQEASDNSGKVEALDEPLITPFTAVPTFPVTTPGQSTAVSFSESALSSSNLPISLTMPPADAQGKRQFALTYLDAGSSISTSAVASPTALTLVDRRQSQSAGVSLVGTSSEAWSDLYVESRQAVEDIPPAYPGGPAERDTVALSTAQESRKI